jgi:hypothetical protein
MSTWSVHVGLVGRLQFLSAVQEMARAWNSQIAKLPPAAQAAMAAANDLGLYEPDWNRIMRSGNTCWDLLAADDAHMTPQERAAHWAEVKDQGTRLRAVFEAEIARNPQGAGGLPADWLVPRQGEARDAYSDRIGAIVIDIMWPSLTQERNDSGNWEVAWTVVAVELTIYRRDNGAYPNHVQDLVPRYIARVPDDPPGSSMRYERQGDAAVLERVSEQAATRPTTNPDMNGDFFIRLP